MVPFKSVTDPVGPGQANRPVDVALVQDLLVRSKAATPPTPGGPGSTPAPAPAVPQQPTAVDGTATETLFTDIADFQTTAMKTPNPDRIVSPGGPTYKRLLAVGSTDYKGPAQFLQSPTGQWKSLNQTKFLTLFAAQFALPFDYNWVTPQPAGLSSVLRKIIADTTVQDVRWAAYMLATVQRESPQFLPVEEDITGSQKAYAKAVVYVDKKGKQHTNVYKGRGYVQLTWLDKYLKLGQALGTEDALAADPAKALDTDTAYTVMSVGMVQGLFTQTSLPDVIGGDRCDYQGARAIINGVDKMVEIAVCASMIEGVLWLATPAVPVLPGAAK